VDVGNMF